jgi:hypothetical protein
MIETNTQHQQQGVVSLHPSLEALERELTVTCGICEAVYVPSPLQLPFLQYAQEVLEATFMGMCHFCFRCRRAACPQCWDSVHGVCGSCVLEAKLPFRVETAPLDGLVFPPPLRQPPTSQQQQVASLFVLVRNGRFSIEKQARTNLATPDIDTDPAVKPLSLQTVAPDNLVTDDQQSDVAVFVAAPPKTPLPEVSKDTRKQEKKPRVTKKASRLELIFTWIVLVIVLVLVVVIALAEYIPAVNALILRVTHIDIHAEIAYVVHVAQQLFKK